MAHKIAKLCLAFSLLQLVLVWAKNNQSESVLDRMPPIETFLAEPIEMESIHVWVPANKIGPIINRSCQPKKNCSFSCLLPASVEHSKAESCPNELARLLAEYAAHYHEKSLPLTIFNGWQWEYSYSLCQFELVSYDLPRRGGCWENSWEAVLTETTGSASFQWLDVSSQNESAPEHNNDGWGSSIKVRTFNNMRTRDGYPKTRQLQD